MTSPRIGSLFSGAGMLDEGVRSVIGGSVAWHAEYEPPTEKSPNPRNGAARVLAYRYPTVPNLGDVTAIDWADVEPVDVLTGGSPCQDVSGAGKRAGMTEGTRSNLWVAMRDAVAALRPGLVVWENVRGAYSACADSEMGRCPRCVDPDSTAGHAPYLRALGRVLGDLCGLGYDCRWVGLRASDVGACHGRFRVFVIWDGRPCEPLRGSQRGNAATGDRAGTDATADAYRCGLESFGRVDTLGRDADRRRGEDGTGDATERATVADAAWGAYAPAVERWARVTGRPAPAPTETGPKGAQRLSPRLTEWMMGWPDGWVTDVPGISRNDALKICGNGVVPQQAAAAVRIALAAHPSSSPSLIGAK